MDRKKLPIGIQTFRKIREDDCYYVDKTGYADRLLAEGSTYFLSRPRRFGKSLFIDTLAEMFAGNKALFEGLACYDTWDWDTVYPVVRISFADGVVSDRDQLAVRIDEILTYNEERLGLPAGSGSVAGRFGALIQSAEAEHGQRVVVLVDEYDKPILDNFTDPARARQMRDGLRDLYSVVKGQDAHIKFVMLTGVSKFSKVSLFSGLNNLNDITMDAEYSALCGYTDHDVDTVFAPELEGLDREKIRQWYNGYNWTGEAVYNPYDLLQLLQKRQFRPYWFESATPTFLVDTLAERQFYVPDLQRLEATEAMLSTFDVDKISTVALLFQTGYLTIDRTRDVAGALRYVMRLPNREVHASLNESLLAEYSPDPDQAVIRTGRLPDLLAAADLDGIERLFRTHFASIPHDWYRNNTIAQAEGYYSSVFYTFFASLGLDTTPEDTSSRGRLDLAVRYAGQVFLFEIKTVDHTPTGRALQQIKDRRYADKYLTDGTPVHLVGVEFSKQDHNIVAFDTETITS
ncbi:MAG: ATP-binding protein [Micrococcales bacterium]|nr:ATP-binding protein [Micrococcales bacterium]